MAFEQDRNKGLAVERQRHRTANIEIVEGRRGGIDDDVGADVVRFDDAYGRRGLRLDVLEKRDRHFGRECHIELPGDKTENRGRPVGYDGELDTVEMGKALLPIIRVPGELDRFVGLELDELERAGADRFGAHVSRRNMAGVDRWLNRSEQGQ